MNAGALDVFHDAWQQTIDAVGNHIDFGFFAHHVFIDQQRLIGRDFGGGLHIGTQVGFRINDFHRAPAQHITWPHQNRITDAVGDINRRIECCHSRAFGLGNAEFNQQFIEAVAVFGKVDGIELSSEDFNSGIVQRLGQIDRGLSAKLNDDAQGLFAV